MKTTLQNIINEAVQQGLQQAMKPKVTLTRARLQEAIRQALKLRLMQEMTVDPVMPADQQEPTARASEEE